MCVVKKKGTVRCAGIVGRVMEKVVRVGTEDVRAHACEEVCGVVVEVRACVWNGGVMWWRGVCCGRGGGGVGWCWSRWWRGGGEERRDGRLLEVVRVCVWNVGYGLGECREEGSLESVAGCCRV